MARSSKRLAVVGYSSYLLQLLGAVPHCLLIWLGQAEAVRTSWRLQEELAVPLAVSEGERLSWCRLAELELLYRSWCWQVLEVVLPAMMWAVQVVKLLSREVVQALCQLLEVRWAVEGHLPQS